MKNIRLNKVLLGVLLTCILSSSASVLAGERAIYQLKIYSIESVEQEQRMDNYLKNAFIPAIHRTGIKHVGVFKPVEEDEMAGKLIYVLIPFNSLGQFEQLETILNKDVAFLTASNDYTNAAHDNPPYMRIESVLLKSFSSMPEYGVPTHTTASSERIYELRSYQGATEKLYQKKVEMFNEGGESKIFMDLGFQPVFFAEVISGSKMPNLMYMTTFDNRKDQEDRWDAFRSSPDWAKLKIEEQYKNTVSHIDKNYLHPTEYSEL